MSDRHFMIFATSGITQHSATGRGRSEARRVVAILQIARKTILHYDRGATFTVALADEGAGRMRTAPASALR